MRRYSKYRITTLAAILFLSLLVVTVAATGAHAEEASEYQVKAAFLFNFAKFVEWPDRAFAGPEAPLMYCVIGDDVFGGALDSLRNKRVKNRPVAVKHVKATGELSGCHVLFISPADGDRLEEILPLVKGSPVLVVGDTERFARRGGAIGFQVERKKVVFEINAGAAREAGLVVSSQLLRLARNVVE